MMATFQQPCNLSLQSFRSSDSPPVNNSILGTSPVCALWTIRQKRADQVVQDYDTHDPLNEKKSILSNLLKGCSKSATGEFLGVE